MKSTSQPLMDLLTQDSEADLQLLTTSSDATPRSSGKGLSKCGSNYTHEYEDDIQLCICWMNVSNDLIVTN
jgi:hypothetical protein